MFMYLTKIHLDCLCHVVARFSCFKIWSTIISFFQSFFVGCVSSLHKKIFYIFRCTWEIKYYILNFLYFSEHSLYALVASEHLSASAQWRTFVIIREMNATNLMASIPRANKDVISHINIVVKHIFFIFTKR